MSARIHPQTDLSGAHDVDRYKALAAMQGSPNKARQAFLGLGALHVLLSIACAPEEMVVRKNLVGHHKFLIEIRLEDVEVLEERGWIDTTATKYVALTDAGRAVVRLLWTVARADEAARLSLAASLAGAVRS